MVNMLRRMIQNGKLANAQEKLDTFLAFDRITAEEYEALCRLLAQQSVEG